MSIMNKGLCNRARNIGHGVWVPAFAGTTMWWMSHAILTVDRAPPHRHGARNSQPRAESPHVLHRHALDSLHHHGGAGAGGAERDAAAIDRAARHLGRHQYPLPVWLSVLTGFLRRGDGRDRRPFAVAHAGVLAVA